MRHIAVVGAGFAGLATAYYLKKDFDCQVTLFASQGPLSGASAVATGLLHPFLGAFAKLADYGAEAFDAARSLIDEIESSQNTICSRRDGIFRPALFPRQERSFKKQAKRFDEIEWISSPSYPGTPGILIQTGLSVFSRAYLQALWDACKSLGVNTEIQTIQDLKQVEHFDDVVWATGADTCKLKHLSDLPLNRVKGQSLRLEWPQDKPKPPWGVIARKYLLMDQEESSCIVGASYEEEFEDELPDLDKAIEAIIPSTASLDEEVANFKVLECKSGIRVHAEDKRRPLLMKLDNKNWIFTGLGSRGLLYHAFCGKSLAYAINQNSDESLPFRVTE